MSIFIQSSYPSYNNVTNYSGSNTSVKSAGRVNSVEQNDAVIALEREGKLNLSQFGFIRLPREVLYAQDIRESRVKATRLGDQVQSSSKADSDEDRTLNKVKDATDGFDAYAAIEGKKENGAQPDHEKRDEDRKEADKSSFLSDLFKSGKTGDAGFAKADSTSTKGDASTAYASTQAAVSNPGNGQQLSVTA